MSIFSNINVAIVVLLLNAVTFALYGIDKRRARRGRWRIPEAVLLSIAGLGGSLGAYAGMEVFRHKTHHRLFTVLVPAFVCLHAVIVLYALLAGIR